MSLALQWYISTEPGFFRSAIKGGASESEELIEDTEQFSKSTHRADDLAVYILIVIPMKSGHTTTVANPKIDSIRALTQSDTGPRYICFDVAVEARILVS